MMGGGGGGGYGQYDGWDDENLGAVYDRSILVRLIPYIGQFKLWATIAVIGMLAATFSSVAMPLFIGLTVDTAIATGNTTRLVWMAGLFFGLVVINAIGLWLQSRYMAKVAHAMLVNIRTQLFGHLQKQSLGFYDKQQVGRLMSRVVSDVEQIQQVMTGGVIGTISDVLTLVGIVVIMLVMDWSLAVVTLSVVPALIVISIFWQRRARVAFLRVRRAISVVNGSLQENVSGVRVVQSMNREDENMRRFDNINHDHLDANLRASRLTAGMFPAVEIMVGISMAIVIIYGGWQVLQGALTVGFLVAFTLWVQRFFDPIRNITMQYTELQRAMASGQRIFELLDTQPQVADKDDAQPIPPITGRVTFENVSFSYADDIPVLRNVSLDAEPGETIALVGETGAGKTTFVSLIARFYDVTRGRLTIDGLDVRDVQHESLAHQMGIVPQEPFLFSDTIEANIRFGKPDATRAEVEAAARGAGLHEIIMHMDNGYDTELQERGANLSVGHRQLVSFARAILADPRILILDEATANIDTRTEARIQDALRRLLPGRTSFVIAHRLSTIREASRIVVMDNGSIVEIGTHNQLLANDGIYARLNAISYGAEATNGHITAPSAALPAPAGGAEDSAEDK
ncbi:MAG: ABC transporter ATP-binding protein [Chloroflexi bacterium]|nr:ABC transporter ATP-binding protein [Chloroflexota bacterium]